MIGSVGINSIANITLTDKMARRNLPTSLNLDKSTREALRKVAKAHGISVSALVRAIAARLETGAIHFEL